MTEQTTLLVVDDMEINRAILKELFQQDCVVLEAENGKIALELFDRHPEIDIVIMDIVMPVMDGFELLTAIRSSADYSNLPVVICTEHSEVDMQVRALDLGSTDFITKPFNALVVRHRIRNLIEMRRMERKIAQQRRADHLRNILSSIESPLGLFEFTGTTVRPIYLNQGFYEIFPTGEDRRFFADIVPSLVSEDAERLVQLLQRSQQDGSPVDMTYRVVQKDQSVSTHEMHALSIRYENFENPVYLASFIDVTNQRRTEVALRDIDRRMQSLINAIPGGILTLDLTHTINVTYFNDAVCEALNLSRAEFQERSHDLLSFVYKPDLILMERTLSRFIENPTPFSETFRIAPKGKALRWIRMSGAPILTADHTLLCNCICIDVSAERENELKLEQAFRELQYRSEHDQLTGLWNRETFHQKTHEFLVAHLDTAYVLLAMNIQRFKVVNELFGQSVGDEVLRTLSRALEHMFGTTGTCGRMEADHFMACIPAAELDMTRVVRELDNELKIQYSEYRVELFFGVYPIQDPYFAMDQMCDRATLALETIKGSAIKRFAFYDGAMWENFLEEQEIIEEMHDALDQGQFVPYLQPIYGLSSLKPVSAEVLVRWIHPVKGLILPKVFVPLFERNGFITKLDFWIWEQACKLLRQWKDEGLPVVPLSLNISRIDLYYPHLCEHLLALLEKYDLDTSLLKLEITESAYIDDPQILSEVANCFRVAGFEVLMDDFGSGHSSLSTLKDMPMNIIKIDMRFLAALEGSPRAANILTSVIRMAKWLNMPVIAEGVETKSQLDFLHSIGCDMGQGYYFSKPLPASDFEKLQRTESSFADPPAASPGQLVDLGMLWDCGTEINRLFAGAVGGIAVFEMIRKELKIQRASDTYYQVVDCTPQEVFSITQPAFHYFSDADQRLLLDTCHRAAASNQLETAVVCRMREYGAPIWLEYKIRQLTTSTDYSVFFILVSDISAQRKWEHLLFPIDEQYQKIFFSETLFVMGVQLESNRVELVYQAADAEEQFYPYHHYSMLNTDYCHPQDLLQVKEALSQKSFLDLCEAEIDEQKIQLRIKNRQGEWVWVEVAVHLLKSEEYTQAKFLVSVKVIDHQKRTEAELLTRAEIDSISLLYNRGTIQDRISKRLMATPSESHAFFLLDIDSFKQINDTLGHAIGDEVILSIATVLRKRFRSTDLIGRLGGDEFAALMTYHPKKGKSDIHQTAIRIMDTISEIVLPGHWEFPLTVSLGISAAPQDGVTFEDLYQHADKALYSVKARGKNGYALYSDLPLEERLT